MRRRVDAPLVFTIVAFVVLGFVALGVATYLLSALGAFALVVAFTLALVPMVLVVLAIRWIDAWEPEPRWALALAFLWGAAASIAIALIFDLGVQLVRAVTGVPGSDMAQAVVQAPIVEEFGKGLGLLLLVFLARAHVDGPLDGVVYGAMIGIGFAFTENIQYFGLAVLGDGLAGVGSVFVLRGILSPFAHVMFTALTGLAIGWAAARGRTTARVLAVFLPGLIPGILLHALWNGAASVVGTGFFAYYATVQVPLFVAGIAIVVVLRRQELRLVTARLAEYAAAGWFDAREIWMLGSGRGRAESAAWARKHGLGGAWAAFTRDATTLAMTRERVVRGRDVPVAQAVEADLLDALRADRHALGRLPVPPALPSERR